MPNKQKIFLNIYYYFNNSMKIFCYILSIILFLFQEPELDTEFDPIEIYQFVLIFLGIILIIIILVYIILSSRQE